MTTQSRQRYEQDVPNAVIVEPEEVVRIQNAVVVEENGLVNEDGLLSVGEGELTTNQAVIIINIGCCDLKLDNPEDVNCIPSALEGFLTEREYRRKMFKLQKAIMKINSDITLGFKVVLITTSAPFVLVYAICITFNALLFGVFGVFIGVTGTILLVIYMAIVHYWCHILMHKQIDCLPHEIGRIFENWSTRGITAAFVIHNEGDKNCWRCRCKSTCSFTFYVKRPSATTSSGFSEAISAVVICGKPVESMATAPSQNL